LTDVFSVRNLRRPLAAYALLALMLWTVPLLSRLHVESAAIIAAGAYFIAGLSALARFREGEDFGRVLLEQQLCLLAPWALLTVTLLWASNCGYVQGLLFFALFPVVTVVFAVSLAYLVSALPLRRGRWWFVGVGLAVMALGPLYDLGLHPQFYTYNHVFGGVLGPIYDDELAVRTGLFVFRGLTLLWAALFVIAGKRIRMLNAGEKSRFSLFPVAFSLTALLIGLCYLFGARLGINTPAWHVQEQLGGRFRTEHFDIYYAPESTSGEDLRRLARRHEFQYDRLRRILNIAPEERIRSYLYPSPDVKGQLTGARRTSVAPVWLDAPQVHMLREAAEGSLGHELAHVFSRSFGMPVLRASASVGLVEGLAVALEPPSGPPSPSEQVAASALSESGPVERNLAREVAARMQPLGFWTGRGAVSYAATGSFVRYLLDAYGPAPLRRAYAWGDFHEAYGKPAGELAEAWARSVFAQPVVSWASGPTARERFSVPSLFEEHCPHHVPSYRQAHREARDALDDEDTTRALRRVRQALDMWPRYTEALALWSELHLARGHPDMVRTRLAALPKKKLSAVLLMRWGDAEALAGHPGAARRRYERARNRLPLFAHAAAVRLLLREAVAHRREVVRVLASGRKAEEQAEAMASVAGSQAPSVRALRALRLAEASRYEQAGRILRRLSAPMGLTRHAPGLCALAERQMLVWRARLARRAGRLAAARQLTRTALRRSRAAGDLNRAAYLRVVLRELDWLRNSS